MALLFFLVSWYPVPWICKEAAILTYGVGVNWFRPLAHVEAKLGCTLQSCVEFGK